MIKQKIIDCFNQLFAKFSYKPTSLAILKKNLLLAQKKRVVNSDSVKMIEGVLNIANMQLRDIMVSKAQMIVINKNMQLEDLIPQVISSGYSRFPVSSPSDTDKIEGILLAKDLLENAFNNKQNFSMEKILRPAIIVPESKRLHVLLKEFQLNHHHMALVANEYGKISGLVTIEDLLEVIVGDIEDEYDLVTKDTNIVKQENDTYIINSLTTIKDFNLYFRCNFADHEYDTVGGLVLEKFAKMPKRGEEILINKFKFKVISADKRRIKYLQVNLSE